MKHIGVFVTASGFLTDRPGGAQICTKEYITTLRAKGLGERSVVLKHALKNALLPIISTLGGFIAQLLCGTFVVEHFFDVPGLGSLMLSSIGFRDHFEILGCSVILTIILMFMCPIFYPASMVPKKLKWVIEVNPMAVMIEDVRGSLLYGVWPNMSSVVYVFVVSLSFAIAGYAFFMRSKNIFADLI